MRAAISSGPDRDDVLTVVVITAVLTVGSWLVAPVGSRVPVAIAVALVALVGTTLMLR